MFGTRHLEPQSDLQLPSAEYLKLLMARPQSPSIKRRINQTKQYFYLEDKTNHRKMFFDTFRFVKYDAWI